MTKLFDASYMPELENTLSPYAFPAAATDSLLITALPNNRAMYLCGWDMLLQEGKVVAERLKRVGMRAHVVIIMERRHAFDKSLCPFGVDPEVMTHNTAACKVLRDAFRLSDNTHTQR